MLCRVPSQAPDFPFNSLDSRGSRTNRTAFLTVSSLTEKSMNTKIWQQAKEVAEEVNLLSNLKSIVDVLRRSGIRIFFVPHHRWEPGDYTHRKHATTKQLAGAKNQIFAKGTWGGEWHPDFVLQEGDIIIKEHWAQSAFANNDLDQQLKQHGTEKIILIGMLANTCIESTGRFGMELGYHAEGRFDRLIQTIKNKPICLRTQKKSISSLV
jgi:nicotinamidase-related amidase